EPGPPIERPLPLWRRGRLEPRGDGEPRHGPPPPLLAHARARGSDEGDLDPGRGRVPRRARGLRPDLVVAQAGAGTVSAGARRREWREGDRPRGRVRRRVDAEP